MKIKNIKELASKIAKLEGKKSQVEIGNIREILAILSDLIVAESLCIDINKKYFLYKKESVAGLLKKNGEARAKRKLK